MTNRTWIGGGNNQASNPNDWVDSNGLPGAPQPGDTLSATNAVIHVTGNALQGDTLSFDSQNDSDHNVIDVDGASQFDLVGRRHSPSTPVDTVNLSRANWQGNIHTPTIGADFSINANDNSVWQNQGDSVISAAFAKINVDVLGIGSFKAGLLPGTFEFVKSVGPGQTVYGPSFGTDLIDDPRDFLATAVLEPLAGANGFDLAGLAQADSYTYVNDMVSIYSGNHVIDTLKLVNNSGSDLAMYKMSNGSVLAISSQFSAGGDIGASAMPIHS